MRNVIAASFVFSCYSIPAAGIEMKVFGHELLVIEAGGGTDSLSIDGRKIHTDEVITLREVTIVAGVPTVIGSSSAGGNACDAAPFVISFPPGKAPRFDGPLETCNSVSVDISETAIEFATTPLPGMNGERWTWTPSGFQEQTAVAFAPNIASGWDDLRTRDATHPTDLVRNSALNEALRRAIGADADSVFSTLSGVGSVEFRGDVAVGTACVPHMCGEIEALVVADIRARVVYAAWKPQDAKIKVWPVVSVWPTEARSALRAWAAKWQ